MSENRIAIICKNNNMRMDAPVGITLRELSLLFRIELKGDILAAYVNNKLTALDTPLYRNRTIEFIDITSQVGQRVYLRSMTMLIYKALHDILPDYTLQVEHAISNGYLMAIRKGDSPLEQAQFKQLDAHIAELVQADLTYNRHFEPRQEVIRAFAERGDEDTAELLRNQKTFYTDYYDLEGLPDFYQGALVPSTGYLKQYALEPYFDGFLLRIPSAKDPSRLPDPEEASKVYATFQEHLRWSRIIGLHNVSDIDKIDDKQISLLVKVTEALHEQKIARIADEIVKRGKVRVILIAGPSSSGKTTFSKRLGIQLGASGIIPRVLALDDYFVDRDKTPLDENGEHDFESINALDLELFHQHLDDLIAGKEIQPPTYNFETGKREYNKPKFALKPSEVLVVEGIHGLNPELTANIPSDRKFLIYASALTTLAINNHNRIPTTDTRLLRRIIRDMKYRAYSAEKTILRWPSVRRGEEKWIFPFQENADAIFNSALITETFAIKSQAEMALSEVPQDSDAYPEASRLLRLLQYFKPIPDRYIPLNSLIREFVGGSDFHY